GRRHLGDSAYHTLLKPPDSRRLRFPSPEHSASSLPRANFDSATGRRFGSSGGNLAVPSCDLTAPARIDSPRWCASDAGPPVGRLPGVRGRLPGGTSGPCRSCRTPPEVRLAIQTGNWLKFLNRGDFPLTRREPTLGRTAGIMQGRLVSNPP